LVTCCIFGVANILERNSEKKTVGNAAQIENMNCNLEQKNRCRVLFENGANGVLLTKPDGTILCANVQAQKMFGMTQEEMRNAGKEVIGQQCEKLSTIKDQKDTGTSTIETTFSRKDGSTFDGEVSIILFKDCDNSAKTILTIRDTTERKKTELALQESEEKYRYLFENVLNGFAYCKIVTDEECKPVDFVYIEVNDAFEKLTGLKKVDVVGKKATEAIPGIKKDHPELFEIYGRVAQTGKTEHFEINFKPLDIWLSISVYCPKKGFFATVFENITEQKLVEKKLKEYSEGLEFTVAARTQELVEANDRLVKAERFAAIGELAGMIGHDLRNPLTAIKNAVYYLDRKQSASMDPKTKEMFKIIDRSVEHANKIIGNLLEYSKEISLEIEEATPKSLIDYILLMIQIPDHIKILDRTQDEPTIWVDSNKLERVFINLIKNAIDAMPEKGTLVISSRVEGENVEFTFTDTGIGMSEQTKSKIFMPLFTTKAQGMGFGLAICKRIIEAHGGRITVESSLSKGTTFSLTLPMEQKPKIEKESQVNLEAEYFSAVKS
jgi:PAS domain S-box-containing protein